MSSSETKDHLRPLEGPAIKTLAMPGDANPSGDIFGGWILSQMDIAGGIAAHRRARGRIATVGVEAMSFHEPVLVGDVVSCCAAVVKVGRTSVSVHVETFVERDGLDGMHKVTEGVFTYVALGPDRKPRPVDPPATHTDTA